MSKYKIEARETYVWKYEVEAKNEEEASEKALDYFKNNEDGVTGVCDALHVKETEFQMRLVPFGTAKMIRSK